ncbi:HNH endonuclease signature motif containing protein [Serinibacter arcticus]|uniref:HNH nuclease domain-containing protein n=1 Tax=Serinibacter arcticus TaxID=1655435 RepID=A0A4Z1E4Y1_9MICO|nr:HNH endonuclease signature motif containing protein [Serinibacter arcticus]TGO04691.1 hypothetical protein SERN_2284 [Serinibacter arcticus]
MANQRRGECEAVLEDCLDSLAHADTSLTSALAGADLSDAVELAEKVEQLARLVHRLQVRAAGAVEAESPASRRSDPPPEAPFRRGCDLLRTRLRISGREASRRIRAASAVLPRRALSGDPLAPVAPVLSARIGLADGGEPGGDGSVLDDLAVAPGPENVEVVLRTLEEARAVADPAVVCDVERTLVGYAETFDPDTMRRVARRLLSLLDPDGVEPSERDAASRQGVKVGATWHGLTHLDVWADAVQTEVLMTVFDTGTNPRAAAPVVVRDAGSSSSSSSSSSGSGSSCSSGGSSSGSGSSCSSGGSSSGDADALGDGGRADPDGGETPTAGAGETSLTLLPPDGAPHAAPIDDRSRPQRMLDALVTACQAALRTAGLPSVGGLPPQLLVTVGIGDLQAATLQPRRTGPPGSSDPPATTTRSARAPSVDGRTGRGRLPHAGPVPVSLLRRLACDADIIPIVMGGESEILDVGRARRLVPAAMRRALIARDGGCLFPGCTIPSTWTEGHHVVPWSHGGPTSIDNTAMLCSAHHHAVHSGRWVIEADPRWVTAKGSAAAAATGGANGPVLSRLEAVRPFRVTAPWAALGRQTWNAYPVGA